MEHKLMVRRIRVGDATTYRIRWETVPIDKSIYETIRRESRKSRDFGPTTPEEWERRLARVNGKVRAGTRNINIAELKSLYHILMQNKIILRWKTMSPSKISQIADRYATVGIMELSREYDAPPVDLMMKILMSRAQYRAEVINEVFGDGIVSDQLNERDREQFKVACEHDVNCAWLLRKVHSEAARDESRVIAFFRDRCGIKMYDQNELAELQRETHGRAMCTPDIVFRDDVFINDRRVRWLEFKGYIGTTAGHFFESNINQAMWYVNINGEGALCYMFGHMSDVVIEGMQVLDAYALPNIAA